MRREELLLRDIVAAADAVDVFLKSATRNEFLLAVSRQP
jgi:uncharacterized protein with HEPN domain